MKLFVFFAPTFIAAYFDSGRNFHRIQSLLTYFCESHDAVVVEHKATILICNTNFVWFYTNSLMELKSRCGMQLWLKVKFKHQILFWVCRHQLANSYKTETEKKIFLTFWQTWTRYSYTHLARLDLIWAHSPQEEYVFRFQFQIQMHAITELDE